MASKIHMRFFSIAASLSKFVALSPASTSKIGRITKAYITAEYVHIPVDSKETNTDTGTV